MSRIQDRFVREVVCVDAAATCVEASRLMTAREVGSAGVRRGAEIVGLVTERDIVFAVAAGADPARTPVSAAMRPDLPAVDAQATTSHCAQLMRKHRTRHLAVKEGARIVGILSLLDLADLMLEEKQWSLDQLETYIRGGRAMQLSEPIVTTLHHEPVAAS